ncbi:MAG TPA: thiamine pyrophosphate-binding protein [Alphaproteobacteria bacterium]|nr:thiamine pyrophosphate-binding protein [Alphaproteobacteria bacterium]
MAKRSNVPTGGMVISRALRQFGVETTFALAGASHTFLLDALDRDGFTIVPGRHETATVAAADGYSRVTGKLGVALIVSDQGMPNAVTGVLTAFEACSPVLVLVARLPINSTQPEEQIDHDALALMRPICKWARTVHSKERLREYVEAAARRALSGRPGPVVLQIPQEFLGAAIEEAHELDAALTDAAKPEPAAAAAAADLLAKARRPMILAGSGAARAGAGAALRKLSRDFRIPVLGNALGRGLVPEDDELGWSWPLAQVAAKEADVVLWLGCRMTQRLGYGLAPRFAGDAKFIVVDIDPAEIGRNRAADVGVAADTARAADAIHRAMKKRKAKPNRSLKWFRDALKARLARIGELGHGDTGPIHPFRLARELMQRLPANAIYVGDGADIQNWMHAILRVRTAPGFLDHYPLGSMGIGTPLALGAAAGAAEMACETGTKPRPIVLVTGDGSFGFYPSEFNGAVRAGLKFITLISNDGAWGTEKHGQMLAIQRTVNTEFGDVRYDLIARAFGCGAERVREPADLGPALDRAFAARGAYVIDVVTDPEAGRDRKEDPRLQMIAFDDLAQSRKRHYTPAVA